LVLENIISNEEEEEHFKESSIEQLIDISENSDNDLDLSSLSLLSLFTLKNYLFFFL
jgi:hypothetical protein